MQNILHNKESYKLERRPPELKATQRTVQLLVTSMLVFFMGLILVACPVTEVNTNGDSGNGTDFGDNGTKLNEAYYTTWTTEQNADLAETITGNAITTVEELKAIANNLGASYHLGANIDISGETSWIPIGGSTTTPFTGTLHGNGYAINGLTIGDANTPAADYQGLFGVINGATIENLFIGVTHIYANSIVGALAGMVGSDGTNTADATSTLTNIAVAGMDTNAIIRATGSGNPGSGTGAYLGGLVGFMNTTGATATTDSRHVLSAYNYGLQVESTDTGGHYVGGVVGYAHTSDISGYATGAVSGASTVGGQVGYVNTNSTVNGYATGVVDGNSSVGGQVGNVNDSTVSGYATGTVNGAENVGGQVGVAGTTSTVNGYATGVVNGNSSVGGQVGYAISATVSGYATGTVNGSNTVGGQVGNVNGSIVRGYATGVVNGTGSVGGQVGYGGNTSTVSGYAIGAVNGTGTNVGGQVGLVDNVTVNGYARGTVTRTGGTSSNFGMFIGNNDNNSTLNGFHSEGESALLDSDGTTLTGTSGLHGTAVTMGADITDTTFSATLTFSTAVGGWTWVAAGQWPAINLGTDVEDLTGSTAASGSQPTQ